MTDRLTEKWATRMFAYAVILVGVVCAMVLMLRGDGF